MSASTMLAVASHEKHLRANWNVVLGEIGRQQDGRGRWQRLGHSAVVDHFDAANVSVDEFALWRLEPEGIAHPNHGRAALDRWPGDQHAAALCNRESIGH